MNIKETQKEGVTVIELKCLNTVSISASRFKNYLMKFIYDGKKNIVLDFSETNHINSSMLVSVIFMQREFKLNGGDLRVVRSKYHRHVWSLFELSKANRELHYYENRNQTDLSYSLN
jgi:anti-anti-sigma regulatory factor